MASIGKLHTFQDKHAIREAVISFMVSPQIINPENYRKLLDEGCQLYGQYHKFEPVKVQELKSNEGINDTTYSCSKDAGFKLIAFRNGKTAKVVQGLNQARTGLFTFNTIEYDGWNKFVEDTIATALTVAELQDVYEARAFSLMYVDEFYFEGQNTYSSEQLFNFSSRNLPNGIEDSDFVDYNFSLRRNNNNKTYMENLGIKVMPLHDRTVIRIIDNLTFEIEHIRFSELLKNKFLRENLDFCHKENKRALNDIINPEISKLINL